MFWTLFLMIGIGTTVNWTVSAAVDFLQWDLHRKKQLTYDIVCMVFLWSQLWVGSQIEHNDYILHNWQYMLFGYFLYETGYMIENRECFTPHGYRVWIQHHLLTLVLNAILIAVLEMNLITVRPQDPQWGFYWHWTTVVYFVQLIHTLWRNRLDWVHWKIRFVTFLVQRVFRILILAASLNAYWDNPILIFTFVVPIGLGFEIIDVYYDADSIYRLYHKLLKM
jgi:hypothetical protein